MCAQKFTLSFTKKIEKKSLQPSVIRNDAPPEVKDTTEALQSIEENVLKTDALPEEAELVIPMVKVDRTAIFQKLAEKLKDSREKEKIDGTTEKPEVEDADFKEEPRSLTLDEQAAAAVLEDSKRMLDGWSEQGTKENITISMASKENNIDTGTQMVDLGKESSLDDYDQVDVSLFGAALLRGMGWKKSEGIGRGNKRVVEIITPSSKSFGLAGKNAEGQMGSTEGKRSTQEEELPLTKGVNVFIHSGRHRGTYGVVDSLDEDHLIVKAALSQNMIREVELNVRVVSQREFKDSSRVINKDMYDRFKEEEARKKEKQKKPKKDSDEIQNIVAEEGKKNSKEGIKLEDKVQLDKNEKVKEVALKEDKKETSDVEKRGGQRNEDANSRHKNEDKYSSHRNEDTYSTDRNEDAYSRYRKEDTNRVRAVKGSKKYHEHDGASRGELISDRYSEKCKSNYREKYINNEKSFECKKNDRPNDELSKLKYSNQSESSYSNRKSKTKRGYDEEDSRLGYIKVQKVQDRMPVIPWVRENLRVRLINRSYKGGKYHKEKVIVQNVETAESCECLTEEGKVLREVHPEWLETVIPKIPPQIVMVVRGQQKGQKGRILQLHKEQEKASVQMFEDETVIMKLHYDDICEYVR